ncbi:hypothetical protein AOLI_G00060520 [Acnodon oligacanthus]
MSKPCYKFSTCCHYVACSPGDINRKGQRVLQKPKHSDSLSICIHQAHQRAAQDAAVPSICQAPPGRFCSPSGGSLPRPA